MKVTILKSFIYILALFLLIISIKNIYDSKQALENYPPAWANYFKAAEWARDNLPEDAIIADRKGGLFGTVSRRKCVGFIATADSKALIRGLIHQKVQYVVVSYIPYGDIGRYLVPAINKYGQYFRVVYYNDIYPPTCILLFIVE